MNRFKKAVDILLLIFFVITVLEPLTGIHIHKLASCLFLLLSVIHTLQHRRTLGGKGVLLLSVCAAAFATGILGMIYSGYPVILALHKTVSIAAVFFLAIHLFVYRNALRRQKKSPRHG